MDGRENERMNKTGEEKLETHITVGQKELAGVWDRKTASGKEKAGRRSGDRVAGVVVLLCDDDDDGDSKTQKASSPQLYPFHVSIH